MRGAAGRAQAPCNGKFLPFFVTKQRGGKRRRDVLRARHLGPYLDSSADGSLVCNRAISALTFIRSASSWS